MRKSQACVQVSVVCLRRFDVLHPQRLFGAAMRLLRRLSATVIMALVIWFVVTIPVDSRVRFGQQCLLLLAGITGSTAIASGGWRGFTAVSLVCFFSSIGLILVWPAIGISIDSLLVALSVSVGIGSWLGIALHRKLWSVFDVCTRKQTKAAETPKPDRI